MFSSKSLTTRRRRSQLLVALLCVTLVVAGCVSGQSASAEVRESPSATTLSPSSSALREAANPWGSSVSYNPYSASGYFQFFTGYIQMHLADFSPVPGKGPYGGYFLELATGWQVSHSAITLDLRKTARWQNGTIFTSTDVVTSLLLAGADYNNAWTGIESVSPKGAHKVIVQLVKGAVGDNILTDILQVPIVPASEYGHLVPSGFQHDLVSYWKTYNPARPTRTSIAAATGSSAGKAIAAVAANLVKFEPSQLLGDGPYRLSAVNTTSVLFKKWPGWWGAKSIRVPSISFLATSGANAFGSILNGALDFQTGFQAFTDPEAERIDSTSGEKYIVNPGNYQEFIIMFHVKDYPFNLVGVRKAIAYLINRPRLAELDFGGSLLQQPPTKVPDGLVAPLQRYLTAAEQKALNPYRYNPARATKILQGLGFTKKKGTWYTPKGKPFSFTIYMPAANPPIDNNGLAAAKMLDAFGIKASAAAIETTSFVTQQEQGAYAVSDYSFGLGPGSPLPGNPIEDYYTIFETYNYPATYDGIGSCHCSPGIGIGPTVRVPGLGTVNISAALNEELTRAPAATWSQYAYDWARYVNQQLPFIQIQNNTYHKAYSSRRYTDWPPASDRRLWDNFGPALVFIQEAGYLKARRA